MSLTREWLKATISAARLERERLMTQPGTNTWGREQRDVALAGLVQATERLLELTPEPSPLELDRALVCRLLDREGLSEWEVGFVESIDRWLREKGIPLTAPQRARAEQIDKE